MYENLPLLLISLFIGIISIAAVVLFRISLYNCLAKKRTATQTVRSTQNNRLSSAAREFTPSDHQMIFERMPQRPLRNIPRSNSATTPTQIVQEIEQQLHLNDLRSAYERRDAVDRNNYPLDMYSSIEENAPGIINEQRIEIYLVPPREPFETFENDFYNTNPAPRYVSPDDELPSYEAATSRNYNNDR